MRHTCWMLFDAFYQRTEKRDERSKRFNVLFFFYPRDSLCFTHVVTHHFLCAKRRMCLPPIAESGRTDWISVKMSPHPLLSYAHTFCFTLTSPTDMLPRSFKTAWRVWAPHACAAVPHGWSLLCLLGEGQRSGGGTGGHDGGASHPVVWSPLWHTLAPGHQAAAADSDHSPKYTQKTHMHTLVMTGSQSVWTQYHTFFSGRFTACIAHFSLRPLGNPHSLWGQPIPLTTNPHFCPTRFPRAQTPWWFWEKICQEASCFQHSSSSILITVEK